MLQVTGSVHGVVLYHVSRLPMSHLLCNLAYSVSGLVRMHEWPVDVLGIAVQWVDARMYALVFHDRFVGCSRQIREPRHSLLR